MLRFLLLFIVCCTPFLAAQDAKRLAEVADAKAVDGKFIGSVLVAKDGAVLFEKSYGYGNAEWKTPNTATTKFRIGSLTKQFTAAAILLLEERGKLKLDDPISKYYTEAPGTWTKVTLFHLLTHSSGIPNFTAQAGYSRWKYEPATPAETIAHVHDLPLNFEPGEKYAYTNTGYVLLGYVIEKVSGQSYGNFLAENIFKPLGMTSTGYDNQTALLPERAAGYVTGPTGLENADYVDMRVPHGAGGLYSTTHDLLQWQQALFGGKLLSAASLEKMLTPFKNDYAFGLIVKNSHGQKLAAHSGGIDGFNAELAYYLQDKLSIVVLSNLSGPEASDMAHQLTLATFNEPIISTKDRQAIEVPAEILKSYVGVYEFGPKVVDTIRFTRGGLTTQLSGQQVLPIFPESPTKFFLRAVNAELEFVKDEQGKVTAMILYQNGRTQKAPRIKETVTERQAIDLSPEIKRRYVGTYQLHPGFDLVISLEGEQMTAQATNQPKAAMYPESETSFFLRAVDAQIEFIKDEKGNVTQLILHQGGHDMKATRQETKP